MNTYIPRLSEPLRVWVRFAALLATLLLLALIAFRLRTVFTPLLAAAVGAYVLNPVVTWLERRTRLRRLTTVVLVFILAAALVGGGGLYAYTKLVAQVAQFQENLPRYLQLVGRAVTYYQTHFALTTDTRPTTGPATTDDWWLTAEPLLREYGLDAGRHTLAYLRTLTTSFVNLLTLLLLGPLFTFYFLWRYNDFLILLRDHLPAAYRPQVLHVVTTIDRAIANFFRGRVIVCALVAVISAVGWSLVGVPYSLPLALLAGVLGLVPFLSVLAVPPAALLAWLSASAQNAPWLMPVTLAIGVYLIAHTLETFVLSPLIEGHTTGLHPLTVVIALLVGGELAGLPGLLLAIPAASTLRTLAAELLLPEIRRLAGAPHAAAAPGETDAAGASKERHD